MSEWKSTEPNPDEKHLKVRWQAELKSLKRSVAEEGKISQRKQARIMPLVKASGLSQGDIAKLLKEGREISKKSVKESERQLAKPPFDIEALHKQDLEVARANAKRMESPGNPAWSGYIWNPSYGGRWKSWNGEAEEVPDVTFNVGANRFDPRAQAWGEGWWDTDFSTIHAYLAFRFSPPSWGHLHVYTYPWLHGYYCLYSDDEWYNSEYARAELDTWVDLFQSYWGARQYRRRFTMSGYEIHPKRCGRIDGQYGHAYYRAVGERDTVTIRVGVRLHSKARASGGQSRLNFQAGAANYVKVPYVRWYLHH